MVTMNDADEGAVEGARTRCGREREKTKSGACLVARSPAGNALDEERSCGQHALQLGPRVLREHQASRARKRQIQGKGHSQAHTQSRFSHACTVTLTLEQLKRETHTNCQGAGGIATWFLLLSLSSTPIHSPSGPSAPGLAASNSADSSTLSSRPSRPPPD